MHGRNRARCMRIIAGRQKGARLATPPGHSVRPTRDRVREALFNILDGGRLGSCYHDQVVVDAFAGTGALGLEALSRGAGHVVFVEHSAKVRDCLARNIRAVDTAGVTTVLAADVCRLQVPANAPAGLVLLDPPYRSGLAGDALAALRRCGWAGPGTRVVLELAANEERIMPDWLELFDDRRYGASRLVFGTVTGLVSPVATTSPR